MRIISGKYRGRILVSPKDNNVRPTSDMIKESVFNIIQDKVPFSRFLDLFAGSGAIGIEALSRGAEETVFCDKSKESLKIVKTNLALINENATVLNMDYSEALKRLKGKKFDIVYLDPPFNNTDIAGIVGEIDSNGILDTDGIIIYESLHSKENKPDIENYELIKSKVYGTVDIDFYGKKV